MRQDTVFLFHKLQFLENGKKLDKMGKNKGMKLEKNLVGEIIKKQADDGSMSSWEDTTKYKVSFHNTHNISRNKHKSHFSKSKFMTLGNFNIPKCIR